MQKKGYPKIRKLTKPAANHGCVCVGVCVCVCLCVCQRENITVLALSRILTKQIS